MARSSDRPAEIWLRLDHHAGLAALRRISEGDAQEALRNHVCVETSFCRYLCTGFLGHSHESCRDHHPARSQ